jgi:glycosyltransferase involved in cell wall biosynthesis
LKILLLAQSFEPALGGGPRWTTELSYGLADRHDVLVLTRTFQGYRGAIRPRARLEVRYLPLLTVRGAPVFSRSLIDRSVAAFRPDVVQTSSPSLADAFMPAASRYGIPYVTLFHAQLGASLPAKAVQWLNLRRLQRGEWRGIAVTSEHWRDWLRERGVDEASVRVIPSTVSRVFAQGAVAGAARERGRLVFVGGLDGTQSYKRFDLLLSACARLETESPSLQWQLSVAGDGNLREEFERQAGAAGLAGRVRFLGKASDDELRLLYSTATAIVLPSSDLREGWGLVLAEALCCGAPIVLTSGIGGAATFGAAPGAVVIDPDSAEALSSALRNVLQRESDGLDAERARFAARFHADRVVTAYEALYESALRAE